MFAYYKEHELGTVSVETLAANKTLVINCGEFSYAEVPYYFSIILGVSGTLQSPPLTASEKNIIQNVYEIKHETIAPSVYGDSKLIFNPNSDIKIELD